MNKTFTKINSSIGKKLNASLVVGKSFKLKDFVHDTKNQIIFWIIQSYMWTFKLFFIFACNLYIIF